MDMIERVAKALEPKCQGFGKGDMPLAVAKEFARAAIEAMKDPTFDMLVAGKAANAGPRSSLHGYIYEAMIEAALKEHYELA